MISVLNLNSEPASKLAPLGVIVSCHSEVYRLVTSPELLNSWPLSLLLVWRSLKIERLLIPFILSVWSMVICRLSEVKDTVAVEVAVLEVVLSRTIQHLIGGIGWVTE